jgi:hypothetical protein
VADRRRLAGRVRDGDRRTVSELSLALVLDNARELMAAARYQGLDPEALLVSPACYADVADAKAFERRLGLPLRLLGLDIAADEALADELVELRFPADEGGR